MVTRITKPRPRRWRVTKPPPVALTLSEHPCELCDGRGFMVNNKGNVVYQGLPCSNCSGTGRRC